VTAGATAAHQGAPPPQTPVVVAAPTDPDELYRRREHLPDAERAADIWFARASTGKDFEASWKLARACHWLGTTLPEAEQRDWLDKGVAAGKQAAALEPNKPEGHFWWAADLGEIAQSSKMAGLSRKGEVKSELEKVIALAPGWQAASAESALGQWYIVVPGFMMGGDDKKGIEWLRKALVYAPQGIHIKYMLAEALADDKKTRDEAIALLRQAIADPVSSDFGPEDRQYKAKAEVLLTKLTKK
jgi:hypothetical protein